MQTVFVFFVRVKNGHNQSESTVGSTHQNHLFEAILAGLPIGTRMIMVNQLWI